jgi:hypothetical protein
VLALFAGLHYVAASVVTADMDGAGGIVGGGGGIGVSTGRGHESGLYISFPWYISTCCFGVLVGIASFFGFT